MPLLRGVRGVSSVADTSLDDASLVQDKHIQGTQNVLLPAGLEHSCTERLSEVPVSRTSMAKPFTGENHDQC